MPLFLLAAAPLVTAGSGTAIAGGAAALAIVAYPIHQFNRLIDWLERPASPSLSTDTSESLARQDQMLIQRQDEAETLHQQAQVYANNAAEQFDTLLVQEREVAAQLSSSSRDVVDATAALNEVLLTNTALQEQIAVDTQRYEILLANFQAVTEQLAVITSAREEDKAVKAALQSKLESLTAGATKTEEELQRINTQLQDLVTLTQHQARTIQTLQYQKTALMKSNENLSNNVMKLTQPNPKHAATLKKLDAQLESLQRLTANQAKAIKTLQEQKAGLMQDNDALNDELILLSKLQTSGESAAANRTQFFR